MQAFYQAELQPANQFGEGRIVRATRVNASAGCIFSLRDGRGGEVLGLDGSAEGWLVIP
jgi:hypothetical protein